MRLFIAVDLPAGLKEQLADVQRRLAEAAAYLRFTRPEGIHLTLKFLGEVEPARLEQIVAAMQEAAAQAAPLELVATGMGFFPGLRNARVVWVGVEGDLEPLQRLQRDLDQRLHRLGFPRERGAFTPHLTVARVRDGLSPADRAALERILAQLRPPEPARFPVDELVLFESFLERGGARYEGRARARLGSGRT
jgi:2'-5' RNA ligase